ncbi:MAG TPA: sialate O-acetylesterase [Cellvibrionaceae bacterium]|nr:sialate O-acetylesterase [Cellvibrionaceae bacterium]
MKTKLQSLAAIVSLIALPLTVSAAPDPNFHIYLMLGQSNMEGQGTVEAQDKLPNPRVKVLQDETCGSQIYGTWREALPPLIRCNRSAGSLGPGDTFGRLMAEKSPANVTIGLVGGAYGGARIEFFLPNCGSDCNPPYGAINGAPTGGGYKWVLDLAKKAQQVGVIKGFIFHQGESNASYNTAQWVNNVNTYVTALRKDLNLDASKSPFIAGELPYGACCTSFNTYVNKLPSAVANAYVVPADGGLGLQEPSQILARRICTGMLPQLVRWVSATPTKWLP